MANAALIFAGVIAAIVGFLLLFSLVSRATAAAAKRTIVAKFPADVIVFADDMANNFGLTSKGALQMRGNGGLVLTRDALTFLPLVGSNELHIPLADIKQVSTVRSHLGKSVGRKLLKIDFRDDSVAFFVPDVPAWIKRLPQG